MPIEKHGESVQLHFGFGDIEVAHGVLDIEDSVGCLCFFQRKKANPIGFVTNYEENIKPELDVTPVRMVFEKVESIDVVIRGLEDAKKMMIDKMRCSDD